MTQSRNASAKIAVLVQSTALDNLESKRGIKYNWYMLPDVYFHQSVTGIFIKRNNFFYQVINKVLQRWVSTGIIDHMIKNVFKPKRKFIKEKEWDVLTLENLRFGFVIWLGTCCVSIIAFILELFHGCFVKIRTLIESTPTGLPQFAKIYPISSHDEEAIQKNSSEDYENWLRKTFITKNRLNRELKINKHN